MIQKLLNLIASGFAYMRQHGQLLFVGLLVFVFPVAFLFTAQSFLQTAYDNIQTAEKQRVGMLQDVLATVILNSPQLDLSLISQSATQIASQNSDIGEIRILQKVADGLLIVSSLDTASIGSYEKTPDAFRQTPQDNTQSFIYEFSRDGTRTWQVIRRLETAEGKEFYIFSEHSFEALDATMAARKLLVYVSLAAIFLFLFALAYWLMRQIDWHYKYKEAQRTLDERDLFTNMIAHEFRTPLTAIKGYGSLLGDSKTLQPGEREYLNKMMISSDRLLALINDFLEVARLQSGRMKFDLEKVDIRALSAEVAVALVPLATERSLELYPPEAGEPIILLADKKRLFQVVQNLVSNAIKYTEKGSVTFSLEQTPLAVMLRIKDTGMGISAEDQKKLFAPFSRVGGVEKSGVAGTGLGMWITKQYVELLGGTISVESIKGVGTHVVVTFKRKS